MPLGRQRAHLPLLSGATGYATLGGAVAKSKPWSSASSVPLICAGPGIARDSVVASAVSTVDLAPTFLDYGGVLSAAPLGMSNHSLLDVLSGASAIPSRAVVKFGQSCLPVTSRPPALLLLLLCSCSCSCPAPALVHVPAPALARALATFHS